MKKQTTKKSIVRWGTQFRFPAHRRNGGWVELMAPTIKQLEATWNDLNGMPEFDPKKCTKVKVTMV